MANEQGKVDRALECVKLAAGGIGLETLIDAMLAGPEAERDVLAAISQGARQETRGDADPLWAAYNEYLRDRQKGDPFYTYSGWLRATGKPNGF